MGGEVGVKSTSQRSSISRYQSTLSNLNLTQNNTRNFDNFKMFTWTKWEMYINVAMSTMFI